MSSASSSSAAAREAAAAGLLSSCASPAAIVPSEASRSRFCSISVSRETTGWTWCITRSCTAGLANASRRNSSAGITASRHGTSAIIRTPRKPPVMTAIAPIQVGATWRLVGSVRVAAHEVRLRLPSSSSVTPLGLSP